MVLIYIAAHGGGYDITSNTVIGRIDYDGDEGSGVYNATSGTWFGVDEGVAMWPYELTRRVDDTTIYRDDELREDLQRVRYGRMIICIEGCKPLNSTENDGLSCFSGGFIDDLSGPRRIIITCTDETHVGWAYNWWHPYFGGRGTFFMHFVDALSPIPPPEYEQIPEYRGRNPFREADVNSDGAVSIREAFNYALQHDECGPNGSREESPWLDDNGNRLPTFRNGMDYLDNADGSFAAQTWLNRTMYSGNPADVNNDDYVDMIDL